MPKSGVLPKHVFLTKTDAPYLVFETVGNPPMHTNATIAAAVGRNKTAILRANKGGEISVTKDRKGEWQIDPVELRRIYPSLQSAFIRGNDMQPHLHQAPLLTQI